MKLEKGKIYYSTFFRVDNECYHDPPCGGYEISGLSYSKGKWWTSRGFALQFRQEDQAIQYIESLGLPLLKDVEDLSSYE